MSYRPFEVERELNRVKVDDVVPHDGGEALAEGALLAVVHLLLVVLQTHPELCPAMSGAAAVRQPETGTAVAVGILAKAVFKLF